MSDKYQKIRDEEEIKLAKFCTELKEKSKRKIAILKIISGLLLLCLVYVILFY